MSNSAVDTSRLGRSGGIIELRCHGGLYRVWNEGHGNSEKASTFRYRIFDRGAFYARSLPREDMTASCLKIHKISAVHLSHTKRTDPSRAMLPPAARYCCQDDEHARFPFTISAMILAGGLAAANFAPQSVIVPLACPRQEWIIFMDVLVPSQTQKSLLAGRRDVCCLRRSLEINLYASTGFNPILNLHRKMLLGTNSASHSLGDTHSESEAPSTIEVKNALDLGGESAGGGGRFTVTLPVREDHYMLSQLVNEVAKELNRMILFKDGCHTMFLILRHWRIAFRKPSANKVPTYPEFNDLEYDAGGSESHVFCLEVGCKRYLLIMLCFY